MSKHFIKGALHKKGALHQMLGIPMGHKIPEHMLDAAAKKKGKLGQRGRFAETLERLRH